MDGRTSRDATHPMTPQGAGPLIEYTIMLVKCSNKKIRLKGLSIM